MYAQFPETDVQALSEIIIFGNLKFRKLSFIE